MDQHAGALQQRPERCAVLAAPEIQGDATLVGIQEEENAAGFRIRLVPGKRAAAAEGVAPGRLDLDDVGPEIGEHLGRERAGDAFAVLDDREAFDRVSSRGPR